MQHVVDLLEQRDWSLALVALWGLCTESTTLAGWEHQRQAAGFQARVDSLDAALQAGRVPSEAECLKHPLELIRAVDQIAWKTALSIRSDRPFHDARSRRDHWLWRAGTDGHQRCSLARQPDNWMHWFRFHRVAPAVTNGGIKVRFVRATGALAHRLSEMARAAQGSLSVWVGHFDDTAKVVWSPAASRAGRVRSRSITPDALRRTSIESTLAASRGAGAHLVVMPEMAVDLAMRDRIVDVLDDLPDASRPLLVVPGSFHESIGDSCFNTAPLLDGVTGDVLFTHRKLRVFGREGDDDEDDVAEDILVGDNFQVLASEAGTFGVLICKDFLDVNAKVATLLQEVPVDFILVPSYGDDRTLEGHLRRAKEVATVTAGSHVVVSNIRDVGISDGNPLPGFVHARGQSAPTVVTASGGLVHLRLHSPPTTSPPATPRRPTLRRVK